jgi:hypothetical protein
MDAGAIEVIGNLGKALHLLKRYREQNIIESERRHSFARSPSERKRDKHRKAMRKAKKAQAKQARWESMTEKKKKWMQRQKGRED